MTLAREVFAELHIVFDDPVVDDGQTGLAVDVGMGIGIRGTSVGCPAGVGNAYATQGRIIFEYDLKASNLADRFAHIEPSPVDGRYSGRIVSPILEPSESGYENTEGLSSPDVANNPTHV
jgi:hypothetical protein